MSCIGKITNAVVEKSKELKKIGEDDPRKITHSFKVGLALTLVSLFYYYRPLYDGMGQAGMWAVLTVVVVFEFSAGATLSKSINRGFATLIAGALGVAAEYLAKLSGKDGEAILLGLFVFILAGTCTFVRFLPNVKRKYDYGVMIFILTFSLVAVSGYRIDEILILAHQRLSTILIGGATCILISVFICPVWAGQDLHNLIAANLDKLGSFLEGYGEEFLALEEEEETGGKIVIKQEEEKPFLHIYKSVLNSKSNEESLANFAWWEPYHGRFKFRHPWTMYLKIGNLTRECAYLITTLNGCADSITPMNMEKSDHVKKIQQSCQKMCMECSEVLKESSMAIKTTTFRAPTTTDTYKETMDDLKSLIESSSLLEKINLREIIPLLVVAFVLIDIGSCIENIVAAVDELSTKACFTKHDSSGGEERKSIFHKFPFILLRRGAIKPLNDVC